MSIAESRLGITSEITDEIEWQRTLRLSGQPELLELLRAEILAAVSRHVVLELEKVVVRMERGKQVSTLEVDIEVPNGFFGSSRKHRVAPDRGSLTPRAS
jgi:hypothetical protein